MTHAELIAAAKAQLESGAVGMTLEQDEVRALVALGDALEAAEAKVAEANERGARICEILFRKGISPEKWPDYMRFRSAGDALIAAHETRKGGVK